MYFVGLASACIQCGHSARAHIGADDDSFPCTACLCLGYLPDNRPNADSVDVPQRMPAWRRRALDPDTAQPADLTGNIRP